jgi:hypothetical protein
MIAAAAEIGLRNCRRAPRRAKQRRAIMRELNRSELAAVSGGANKPASHPFPPGQHPNKRNPAKAPGESYKGPADKNFGPK